MIQPSKEGIVCEYMVFLMCVIVRVINFSYLKTLLEPFNEIANNFIDRLKPLADGVTAVPMKTQFGEFFLKVISKVHICAVQRLIQ